MNPIDRAEKSLSLYDSLQLPSGLKTGLYLDSFDAVKSLVSVGKYETRTTDLAAWFKKKGCNVELNLNMAYEITL